MVYYDNNKPSISSGHRISDMHIFTIHQWMFFRGVYLWMSVFLKSQSWSNNGTCLHRTHCRQTTYWLFSKTEPVMKCNNSWHSKNRERFQFLLANQRSKYISRNVQSCMQVMSLPVLWTVEDSASNTKVMGSIPRECLTWWNA